MKKKEINENKLPQYPFFFSLSLSSFYIKFNLILIEKKKEEKKIKNIKINLINE